jgi:hypothetical protein
LRYKCHSTEATALEVRFTIEKRVPTAPYDCIAVRSLISGRCGEKMLPLLDVANEICLLNRERSERTSVPLPAIGSELQPDTRKPADDQASGLRNEEYPVRNEYGA